MQTGIEATVQQIVAYNLDMRKRRIRNLKELTDTPLIKLYLDDERSPPDDSWTLVKTAAEAIEYLDKHRHILAEVSLDHDLGDLNDEANGYSVICWIEKETFQDPNYISPNIHIHTANSSARIKMASCKRVIDDRRVIKMMSFLQIMQYQYLAIAFYYKVLDICLINTEFESTRDHLHQCTIEDETVDYRWFDLCNMDNTRRCLPILVTAGLIYKLI